MLQLVSILLSSISIAYASEAPVIEKIGFSVCYSSEWSANTDFSRDLSVHGGHFSGGDDGGIFAHLTKDTASPQLWQALLKKATAVINIKPTKLTHAPNPVYRISITLSSNAEITFDTPLNSPYPYPALESLRELIKANERIYNNQEGKGWVIP